MDTRTHTHPLVEDLIRWASRGGAAAERLARAESRLLRARKGETRNARGAVTRARAAFATAARRQEVARRRLVRRLRLDEKATEYLTFMASPK